MLPVKGNMYMGKIKFPRSKKKRIRNKWLKRQCLGKCTNFKFEEISEFPKRDLSVNEVIYFYTVNVAPQFPLTLDKLDEENVKLLLHGEWK